MLVSWVHLTCLWNTCLHPRLSITTMLVVTEPSYTLQSSYLLSVELNSQTPASWIRYLGHPRDETCKLKEMMRYCFCNGRQQPKPHFSDLVVHHMHFKHGYAEVQAFAAPLHVQVFNISDV